jgi:aminoglycoside phosphotransferase (APT) family kinase protein
MTAVPSRRERFEEGAVLAGLTALLRRSLHAGVEIRGLRRFTVGFSWLTFGFDAVWSEGGRAASLPLVLRIGPGHGIFAPYSAGPQFHVLRALRGSGVPVPQVYEWSDDPALFGAPFFVCERMRGEAPLPWTAGGAEAFDDDERGRLGTQFVDALVALHAFDWRGGGLSAWGDGLTVDNVAQVQLAAWERDLRRWSQRTYPSLERTLDWLRERCPRAARLGIVHGDYRIGNFLVHEGSLSAVLDWELVHVGDPHEDLGFMCLRTFRGRSRYMCHLVDRETLYERHGAGTGVAVDPQAVDWYEVFGMLKLAIIHVGAAKSFEDGRYNDLRTAAMGAQIPRLLSQLRSRIEAPR